MAGSVMMNGVPHHNAKHARAGGATKWIASQAIPPPPASDASWLSLKELSSRIESPKSWSPHSQTTCNVESTYPPPCILPSPLSSNNTSTSHVSSSPSKQNSHKPSELPYNPPKLHPSSQSAQSPKSRGGGIINVVQREVKEGLEDSSRHDRVDHMNGHIFPASRNEKLYEAYDDLHSLAQGFHKPFDSPAILVVGHQSDGKSALLEALMGFQFNHVGGGTKTRRPISLHMKYNSACVQPRCFLVTEERPPVEEERRLEEIQAYIEAENMRLEREACQFWAKEIVVKIEYKFCPNLTIIDTPGLISAPPGHKTQSLQAAAVEALIHTKMVQKEFIILCLEDCSDWSNATTRRVVMQVDPDLGRTVLVSTKLDTRIPQFARPDDVELFLRPLNGLLNGNALGAFPFFTSVPSGRVGSSQESVFRSNAHFQEAIAAREAQDVSLLEEKLNRKLTKEERSQIGVSRLRWFLEQLLQRRYMENVPSIVPTLSKEFRTITIKLRQTLQDLGDLDDAKLKERGRSFRDSFLEKLSLLLRGTVIAPPEKYGETLQDERVHGGAFVSPDGVQMANKHVPNAGMRLYGGAQYHRTMAEFRLVVGGVKCQAISREEIVNACGVEDIHDGTNYIRTACVIATSKARDVFEPFLHQLGFRLTHILRRLLPIALYLLQRDGDYLSSHDVFMKRIKTAFQGFVESTERSCREKCMEDLKSMTRYVTWSLHNKSRLGLCQYIDTIATSEQSPPRRVASGVPEGTPPPLVGNCNKQDHKVRPENKVTSPSQECSQTAHVRLVNLLETTLWNRKLAPTSEEIVNALVTQIFEGIREHCVASAEMKFNCFFLIPVVDKFPAVLREDLETAFQGDIENVFDVALFLEQMRPRLCSVGLVCKCMSTRMAQVRRGLEQQKLDLQTELQRVEKLQEKFASIHYQLSSSQPVTHSQHDIVEES